LALWKNISEIAIVGLKSRFTPVLGLLQITLVAVIMAHAMM